jgi:hypothetical protein
MPVPLSADPNVLGRLAVKSAPRLAAMLMASHHSGTPLVATAHRVGASPATSLLLSPSNPLARWAERAVDAVGAARAVSAEARSRRAAVPGPVLPAARTPVSAVHDLYKRLLGEGPSTSRPHSIDEQAEAAQPAEAGRSAQVLEQVAHVQPNRTSELVALAAVVVGAGYGDQVDRASTGGNFDVTVFRNLMRAADVIAPGQSIASLDPVRMRAVLAAALQSSNGAFLALLKDGGHAAQAVVSGAKLVQDGAKAAGEFLVNGKFNEAAFLQKTSGMLAQASQVASATPGGAKAMLLIAAAEKAKDLLNEVARDNGPHAALRTRILQSISERLHEMDSLQPPADQPTAPGVR